MKNKNLKKKLFVGLVLVAFVISSLLFLSNFANAKIDDENIEVTISGELNTNSNEILHSNNSMTIGTKPFFEQPELDLALSDHDSTRIDVSDVQQSVFNTTTNNFGNTTIPVNLQSNHTTNAIPSYLTSSPKDTTISVNINYNFTNFTSQSFSYSEVRPKGDNNGAWSGIAMSSDGTKIIVGENPGRLWYSVNSGTNWTEVRPKGDNNGAWCDIAMSSDGTKLLAAEFYGSTWYSANSGTTWTEVHGYGEMFHVAMSSDGTKLLTCVRNIMYGSGSAWYSANSGTSMRRISRGISSSSALSGICWGSKLLRRANSARNSFWPMPPNAKSFWSSSTLSLGFFANVTCTRFRVSVS